MRFNLMLLLFGGGLQKMCFLPYVYIDRVKLVAIPQ